MYPPVHGLSRDALADDEISGMQIRAGDTILLSIFGVHHDSKDWESPAEFRPERFRPGLAWKREAFLPFSVGKHRCIGNVFAQIEMLVALSLIAQRFELSLPDGFEVGEKRIHHAFTGSQDPSNRATTLMSDEVEELNPADVGASCGVASKRSSSPNLH